MYTFTVWDSHFFLFSYVSVNWDVSVLQRLYHLFRRMARSLSNTGRSDRLVIAAIDLGTTYSGYAYTFKHELERERSAKDMCKVLSNTWQSGSSAGLISHKTPTSLLLTKDGEFDSFGYKAEKNYMDLVNGNKHIGWRFYRKFKMLLHKNDVSTIWD